MIDDDDDDGPRKEEENGREQQGIKARKEEAASSTSSRARAPGRLEPRAHVRVSGAVDAMHVKLAGAVSPRDVHREVVVRGHVQDRANVVQIALRHCRAPRATCRGDDERLERDDQRALFQVEEFRSDRFVH